MRSIGEVAESLDLPQHVLRFWETRFKEIDPLKRAGGRRLYRQRDIDIVVVIRHLLYSEGYTIKGVQRILKEQGVDMVVDEVMRRMSGAAERPEDDAEVDQPASDGDVDEIEAEALDLLPTEGPVEPAQIPEAPPASRLVIEPSAGVAPRPLDENDARLLRAALTEIEECRRLLKLTVR